MPILDDIATQERLDQINEQLERVRDTRRALIKAKAAGLIEQAEIDKNHEQEKRLMALKQAFYPGK